MEHSCVQIQISPDSLPSTPSWFGEVAAFAQVLEHAGILKAIQEQVRFARARFGTYELIDFVVVLIGYTLSGESTLLAFYERLAPFASSFMALFGCNQLLHRSTLSCHPESSMTRALYDCPAIPLTPTGPEVRLVVATHPATSSSPAVGTARDGTVYELFVSTLSSSACTASDVLDLYLHRGSFETVLADEDEEQEMDRWYSHTPWGQEFAQILAQWIWNVRLELGQQLSPTEVRTTEFAPAAGEAQPASTDEPALAEAPTPDSIPSSIPQKGRTEPRSPY